MLSTPRNPDIFSLKVKKTVHLFPYFLLGLICLVLLQFLQHFSSFLIIALLFLGLLLSLTQYRLKRSSTASQHILLKTISFLSGCTLGFLNFYFFYRFSFIELFLLSQTLLALFLLTYRLNYFFLYFVPALFPILILNPTPTYIFIALILATVFPIYFLQNNLIKTHLKCHKILKKLKEKNNACQSLQNRLKDLEINRHHYQSSFNLTSDRLEKQNAIIRIINQLTPVKTWEWDIPAGLFKIHHGRTRTIRNDTTIGKYLENFVHPEDIHQLCEQIKHHFLKEDILFKCEYRINSLESDGCWRWVTNVGQVIQRDPFTDEPLYMVGVFQNIEEQKIAQERLEHSSNILQHIDVGIATFDQTLRYVDANPFFYQMIGLDESVVIGKEIFEIADNFRLQQRSLHFSITDQILKKSHFNGEFEEHFTKGNTVYIRCHVNAIRDQKNNIVQYVGIFSNLTHYYQQQKRLSYLENHDMITNLPNCFAYTYKTYQFFLNNEVNQIAIVRIAVDRFNALHAFLGNKTTSLLLKKIAQRLRVNNPNAFIIAYLNREDFVIVYELNHIQPSIQSLCDQILDSFKVPFSVEEHELILTVSIGVAIYPEHSQIFETINQQAEQALNYAQQLGGNSVQYYNPKKSMPIADIHLENELHQAIKNKELELYYQPKINTQTNTIFGFETLIRWNHPTKGLLFPDQFLPAAQQTSIISDIGQYVLEGAIAQLKKWQDQNLPCIQVSVNIDAQQLYRGELLTHLDHLLAKYNVNGQYLEFEMTESSLIENTDYVQRLLHQIKKRQVKLSLDDFGKGYSSLAYLTDFPFDILKLDRQFIQEFDKHKKNAILNAIIAMGNAMQLTLIAEGVETSQQLAYLQSKQCYIVQGYLFSKAIPVSDATYFIQNFS